MRNNTDKFKDSSNTNNAIRIIYDDCIIPLKFLYELKFMSQSIVFVF